MPKSKRASKRKLLKEAVPLVGAVGASLTLAGGASAAVGPVEPSRATAWGPILTLTEEELSDVSLGTFYVFDRERSGLKGEEHARGCGGCGGARGCRGCGGARGCRGCGGARGCRGCGGRGCRGCRGCGGCGGCGGCSCGCC